MFSWFHASMYHVVSMFPMPRSERTKTPTSQLKWILDAWDRVIDCRRVLKWTYAYGFYTFQARNLAAAVFVCLSRCCACGCVQRMVQWSHGLHTCRARKLGLPCLRPPFAGVGVPAVNNSQG